ncbi:MAG: CPBP family intramembrane metalloprotease [Balneolaceae bacterium]|nr:MAG: CPBP family intramembrane metalloprotease [Balneolaceae bacterium]
MIRFIANYFQRTESYSTGRFIFEMYLMAMLCKILIIVLSLLVVVIYEPFEILFFGETDESVSQFTGLTWVEGLIFLCIILPFVESIIGQGIPIKLLSLVSNSKVLFAILSSLWFSYLHSIILEGISFALIIFFGGAIYAWCFIAYKGKGFWKAILVTSIVHGLYNFTAFITYFYF